LVAPCIQVMRNADRPELAERFAHSLTALRPDIAQATARVIFQSDERASLPALGAPTLVVQSSADLAVPQEVGRYLAAHIPRAQLRMIDAEGHLPHMSVPHAVNHAIRECLEQPI
jgi:sigma-B regulation protein RsbQ